MSFDKFQIARKNLSFTQSIFDKLGKAGQAVGQAAEGLIPASTVTYEGPQGGEMEVDTAMAPAAPKFDRSAFKRNIAFAENEGALASGSEAYDVKGVTGDLGRYQLSPQSLEGWSAPWLGKNFTPEEFLASPNAQEHFFDEFMNVAEKYGLTPEEAAVSWHRGWGELGTGDENTREERFRAKLKELMEEAPSKNYIARFKKSRD